MLPLPVYHIACRYASNHSLAYIVRRLLFNIYQFHWDVEYYILLTELDELSILMLQLRESYD